LYWYQLARYHIEINTVAEHGCRKRKCQKRDEKEVMSCGNLLNHGDILLHQSQNEFNSCDLWGGEFKFYLEIKKTNDHLITRSS
jgi:hypothetical protein